MDNPRFDAVAGSFLLALAYFFLEAAEVEDPAAEAFVRGDERRVFDIVPEVSSLMGLANAMTMTDDDIDDNDESS